jgi:hypothetical protein
MEGFDDMGGWMVLPEDERLHALVPTVYAMIRHELRPAEDPELAFRIFLMNVFQQYSQYFPEFDCVTPAHVRLVATDYGVDFQVNCQYEAEVATLNLASLDVNSETHIFVIVSGIRQGLEELESGLIEDHMMGSFAGRPESDAAKDYIVQVALENYRNMYRIFRDPEALLTEFIENVASVRQQADVAVMHMDEMPSPFESRELVLDRLVADYSHLRPVVEFHMEELRRMLGERGVDFVNLIQDVRSLFSALLRM